MTAIRLTTWHIPSTSSRMASRTITAATFTVRKSPETVSEKEKRKEGQAVSRLPWLSHAKTTTTTTTTTTTSVRRDETAFECPDYLWRRLSDFHRSASMLTSAKIAAGEKKIAFPRRLPASATLWHVVSLVQAYAYVYLCIWLYTVSTIRLELRFLTPGSRSWFEEL